MSTEAVKAKPLPPPPPPKPSRTITPPPPTESTDKTPPPHTPPVSASKPKPPPPPPPKPAAPKPAPSPPQATSSSQSPPPPAIARVPPPPQPPSKAEPPSPSTASANDQHNAQVANEIEETERAAEERKGSISLKAMRRMTMNFSLKSTAFIERRKSVQLKNGEEQTATLVGTLSKRNREGNFDKCVFTLTPDALLYQKQVNTSGLAEDEVIQENECKSLALTTLMVCPLRETDYKDNEKRIKAFRLLSKQKSFILRAKTIEMKDEWFQAIQDASNAARSAAGMPSFHETEMAPVWEPNEDSCALCLKAFSFFVRKHHCRNCGACVCELCSKDKVRIAKFDEYALFRVCNHCSKELKEQRVYGFQAELTS